MKKILKIVGLSTLGIVTVANSGAFAYSYTHYYKTKATTKQNVVAQNVKQQVQVKSAKLSIVPETQTGEYLGAGSYAYETVQKSKITREDGSTGHLAIATHAASQANYVLALGSDVGLSSADVNDGWKLNIVNDDPLWLPGACASKPTQLVKGRYVFIDDGKTNPDDHYNSYVFYDIQTNLYKYFGGNHFTAIQGDTERIIKLADENDQVVFYIDVRDDRAKSEDYEQDGLHITGKEKGYVIRRVIDPDTLKFTDYKFPYVVPQGVPSYVLAKAFSNGLALEMFGIYPNNAAYDGKITNNKLIFSEQPPQDYSQNPYDTALDLQLKDIMAFSLPDLTKTPPYEGSKYQTNISLNQLGSIGSYSFFVANDRFGNKSIPTVYNADTKTVSPMTSSGVLQSGHYVPLGVY